MARCFPRRSFVHSNMLSRVLKSLSRIRSFPELERFSSSVSPLELRMAMKFLFGPEPSQTDQDANSLKHS